MEWQLGLDHVWQGEEIRGLGLRLPDTSHGRHPRSITTRLLIEVRCTSRALFNTRLRAERTKSIRVGVLIETYSPMLVLGLDKCHKTKSGDYSTGNRKLLKAFEGEEWCTEDITFGRNVKKGKEKKGWSKVAAGSRWVRTLFQDFDGWQQGEEAIHRDDRVTVHPHISQSVSISWCQGSHFLLRISFLSCVWAVIMFHICLHGCKQSPFHILFKYL